jgi:hypothetical protein
MGWYRFHDPGHEFKSLARVNIDIFQQYFSFSIPFFHVFFFLILGFVIFFDLFSIFLPRSRYSDFEFDGLYQVFFIYIFNLILFLGFVL